MPHSACALCSHPFFSPVTIRQGDPRCQYKPGQHGDRVVKALCIQGQATKQGLWVCKGLPCMINHGVCRALKDADANAKTQQGELGKINPQLQKVDDNLAKLRQEVQNIEG